MPNVEKFKETLIEYNIGNRIIDEMNTGCEGIISSSPKQMKREYFKHAMSILDSQVPRDAVIDLMDSNACCRSHTAREKASRKFAADNADKPIEERIPLISGVKNMGVPSLTGDGKLYILAVQYYKDDRFRCACPSINTGRKEEAPLSRTYCMCCAGHFRYHYQIMLGCKLKLDRVLTSPLDSDGKEPCSFVFDIEKQV